MCVDLSNRLKRCGVDVSIRLSPAATAMRDRCWLALTSSHLGKSNQLHAEVCRYVSRSMQESRRLGRALIFAKDSAIEPWAERAAELFSVPMIRVFVNDPKSEASADPNLAYVSVSGPSDLCRDTTVVALADRVDCVFVRSGSKTAAAIQSRLRAQTLPSVRVAVHQSGAYRGSNRVAKQMMDCGAVGWYCRPADPSPPLPSRTDGASVGRIRMEPADQWMSQSDQWLVHCTRTCCGAWPGQTTRQHRDELLLGSNALLANQKQTPLDSLKRILRMRRLVASAITCDSRFPVVCFSRRPIQELIDSRRYRSHLHRWDYEPYGIAIRKSAAENAGFVPVIYAEPSERSQLSHDDLFRFQAIGNTFDWTLEREWRHCGDVDLDQFVPGDVRVFVRHLDERDELPPWFSVSAIESAAISA